MCFACKMEKKANAFLRTNLCPTIMWSVCNYNPHLRKENVALVVRKKVRLYDFFPVTKVASGFEKFWSLGAARKKVLHSFLLQETNL